MMVTTVQILQLVMVLLLRVAQQLSKPQLLDTMLNLILVGSQLAQHQLLR
ncbi:Uncharacterised protein [Klebsiella grimontii]|uniref:Uncharacterized protein n=1 Tax=Klebsiella grimontii TaxID=2058152 RepID=A0A7H4NX90_9ENTR|nr:hypothetical protein AI2937V1_0858 [Klebsiella oxytoca]CAH6670060.1 hypothetical protein AI2937V1_0858 [Klebsiella oxytoca]STW04805.1 Uncharacterised protein [Klebsiella grimontii]